MAITYSSPFRRLPFLAGIAGRDSIGLAALVALHGTALTAIYLTEYGPFGLALALFAWGGGAAMAEEPLKIRVAWTVPVANWASILAAKKEPDAVERLQRAVPYDLAMPGTAFHAKFGGLYPAYVRGEAYLAAGRGQEAAAEFQKVLDHRGIVLADPIGALAHWKLGKAYVVSGDITKAKNAYRDFLALWKDADPDIPVLKQARAEYAGLR